VTPEVLSGVMRAATRRTPQRRTGGSNDERSSATWRAESRAHLGAGVVLTRLCRRDGDGHAPCGAQWSDASGFRSRPSQPPQLPHQAGERPAVTAGGGSKLLASPSAQQPDSTWDPPHQPGSAIVAVNFGAWMPSAIASTDRIARRIARPSVRDRRIRGADAMVKVVPNPNGIKLTQVATYRQLRLWAKTNRKTFNSKPLAVTA
jgi:hypothetical protein